MRFSLISLTRSLSILVVVLVGLAIAISKVIPEEKGGYRKFAEPRYAGINGSVFFPPAQGNFILDRQTGRLSNTDDLGQAEQAIDFASFAPWRGEHGELEVAGRLVERTLTNGKAFYVPVGVARAELPDGTMLDSQEFDPVLSGNPCWLPGARRRIVFPAAGRLFLHEFSDGLEEASPPRRISENSAFGDVARVVFNDILCPTSPEYCGRLIVSVCFVKSDDKSSTMSTSEIWSIKLDSSRAVIVSAEKMLESGTDGSSDSLPNVVKTADGRHVMAFLNRHRSRQGSTLMLAPVEFDSLKQIPMGLRRSAVKLESDFAFTRPEFSTDGGFVYRIRSSPPPTMNFDRIPVIETLDEAVNAL